MELLNDAMTFAIAAHGGALRKGDGSPAILHAMEAAAVAATLTGDAEVLAAAKANEKIAALLEGKNLVKEIYVPNKIVNFVVK